MGQDNFADYGFGRTSIVRNKPTMKRMKKPLPSPRLVSTGSNRRSSSRRTYHCQAKFSDPTPLKPDDLTGMKDAFLEWAIRRVQHVYLTVKFASSTSAKAEANIVHDCLYCSCRCKGSNKGEALCKLPSPSNVSSIECRHCLYYPESHPGWCIGKLRERSGSIAYVLRNPLLEEMPIVLKTDETALKMLRHMPLGIELIEEVRQRYRTYPLGNETKFGRSFPAENFIASVGLNGYDGYQSMLTNASSTVEPMSREAWEAWYNTQVSFITPPLNWPSKMMLPDDFLASKEKYVFHILFEADPLTGSVFHTQSPRIPVGEDDKYIRLEITSSPVGESNQTTRNCQLGAYRTVRSITSEDILTDPKDLEEDVTAGGYPNATLGSAPLKQFHPGQYRQLRCVLEYDDERSIVGDFIGLADDHRYLKIFLSSN